MQRYKPDETDMGVPYYAPKEEPMQAKDSAQLRKIEERDKQIKYAKKLGENMLSVLDNVFMLNLHRGAAG